MRDSVRDILTVAARRLLATRCLEATAVGAGVAALVAAVGEIVWLALGSPQTDVPVWLWTAGLIAAVAGTTAAWRLVHGVSLREAAVWLDAHLGLRERMATAAELADSPQADSPAATCVYAQAAAAMAGREVRNLRMWRQRRGTFGAVVVAMGLCAVLAALGRPVTPLARSLETLSETDCARLAARLREESRTVGAETSIELARAAQAIEVRNAEELAQAIEKLRALGYQPLDVLPASLLAALDAGSDRGGGKGEGETPSSTTSPGDETPAPGETPSGGPVLVYDPLYDVPAGQDTATAPLQATLPENLSPRDAAWARARQRATAALASGRVPDRYRTLVRDFFAAER